jgi:predicted HTH transcriptional regulator
MSELTSTAPSRASTNETIESPDDVVVALRGGTLQEHVKSNIELKESWSSRCGEKLSALANRTSVPSRFLVVGVADDGTIVGRVEKWAREVEEQISQHVNLNLDPPQACSGIHCRDIDDKWIVIIEIRNPRRCC